MRDGGVVRHKSADGSFGDTLAMAFFIRKTCGKFECQLRGKKVIKQ